MQTAPTQSDSPGKTNNSQGKPDPHPHLTAVEHKMNPPQMLMHPMVPNQMFIPSYLPGVGQNSKGMFPVPVNLGMPMPCFGYPPPFMPNMSGLVLPPPDTAHKPPVMTAVQPPHSPPGSTTPAKELKPYKCPDCPYASNRRWNLQTHMRTCAKRRMKGLPYDSSKTVVLKELRGISKRQRRPRTPAPSNILKPHKCPICPYASDRRWNLQTHMRRHAGMKPYRCDKCDYATSDKSTLNKHTTIHTQSSSGSRRGSRQTTSKLAKISEEETAQAAEHAKGQYKCLYCDFHADSKTLIAKHMLSDCQTQAASPGLSALVLAKEAVEKQTTSPPSSEK